MANDAAVGEEIDEPCTEGKGPIFVWKISDKMTAPTHPDVHITLTHVLCSLIPPSGQNDKHPTGYCPIVHW